MCVMLSSRNPLVVTKLSASGGNAKEMQTMPNPTHCKIYLANSSIACAWASMILRVMSSWTPTGYTTKMETKELTATYTCRNMVKPSPKSLLSKSSSLLPPSLPVLCWEFGQPAFTSLSPREALTGSPRSKLTMLKYLVKPAAL